MEKQSFGTLTVLQSGVFLTVRSTGNGDLFPHRVDIHILDRTVRGESRFRVNCDITAPKLCWVLFLKNWRVPWRCDEYRESPEAYLEVQIIEMLLFCRICIGSMLENLKDTGIK